MKFLNYLERDESNGKERVREARRFFRLILTYFFCDNQRRRRRCEMNLNPASSLPFQMIRSNPL